MNQDNKIKAAVMSPNGTFAAFDQNGMEVAKANGVDALELWAAKMTANGYDVEGCEVRTLNARFLLHRTPRGWRAQQP